MAIAVMPAQSDAAPPAWLLPGQETAFRRALAALEMFGGALVAERTGAGKTYIALAVAAAWSAKPAVCVVPAAIADQWRRTARRLSTEIIVGTHERASRGILPRHAGLVIVDESHRFRNPEARRHSVVARWLVGRPALLLTATPAVNRLADLVAQLRLVVPDDVLTRWGVNSLRSLAAARSMPDAVAHLIVRSASGVRQPDRRYRTERMSAEPECIELIDRLVLSSSAPVARLVRGVLLRAAASSSAALAGVLRRYRLLLLHASDAAGSGVRIGRAALRRCIGAAADQTALWPLLAPGTDDVELALSDIDAIEQIERRARDLLRRPDARAERLGQMLADGRRTLVFTGWRETAEWLRGTLGPARVAWCTGSDAGIGRMRLARSEVLGMFGPHPQRAAPQVLITTDVASEGLDLQGAERVVHYDLPWTPMRLTQRDGRAARLGNLLPAVEIVRFDPPEELDRRLRQTEILRRKGRLPTEAGVTGPEIDRWRALLAAAAAAPGSQGMGVVEWDGRAGILACAVIAGSSSTRSPGEIAWLDNDGSEKRDPASLSRALEHALDSAAAPPIDPGEMRAARTRLAGYLRDVFRRGATGPWARASASPDVRKLARLLVAEARRAARNRDPELMETVDRALRFTAHGHTVGEELLIRELATLSGAALLERLHELPAPRKPHAVDATLVAAVLFRSNPPPLR